jgi:ABC-type transport system involved in cytochrome c biogenesis permease subunit
MKLPWFVLAPVVLVLAGCTEKGPAPAWLERKAPWDADVLKTFQRIPVQDQGRIKPLDTVAGFKLLKLRGARTCPTPQGETLTPIAWLADVLFYPEQAEHYEIFLVQNSDVIDAINLPHDTKRKRDRYSFAELQPGLEKLHELAIQASEVKDNDRTSLQEQVLQLNHNLGEYLQLAHFADFARTNYPLRGSPALQQIFAPEDRGLAVILLKSRQVIAALQKAGPSDKGFQALLDGLEHESQLATGLLLFPSSDPEDPKWLSPGARHPQHEQGDPQPPPDQLVELTFKTDRALGEQIALCGLFEQIEWNKNDPAKLKAAVDTYADHVEKLAETRHEYSKVPLEVAFYKGDFFYRALYLFGFSFLLVAFSWLAPLPILKKGSLALLALGTVFLVAGIVLRCIIRSRPPVSTLYETILFISAVAIVVAAVIELINRQGIAISIAPLLGTMGMFLANKYEFKEALSAGDTMTSLQAVLDTNFWLSTHVTAVTTGYSAGLLAAAIAHVWLLGKVVGYKKGDDAFYKNIARMTYGVLCFGLLFSTVGTILGGIWANYSWGRFWGWDPKENGALLICIWELIILHLRLGGYIRDYGLCALATLGGIVISLSWWGVNLLGVGLHSYGFTSGVFQILMTFITIEAGIVVISFLWWLSQRYSIVTKPGDPGPNPKEAPSS